jgi:hypothetical protein
MMRPLDEVQVYLYRDVVDMRNYAEFEIMRSVSTLVEIRNAIPPVSLRITPTSPGQVQGKQRTQPTRHLEASWAEQGRVSHMQRS